MSNQSMTMSRVLFAALVAAVTVAACLVAFATPAHAAFKPTLNEYCENRPVTESGYLNAQGLAYDTYTKTDGYSFAGGSDGNSGFQLIHFRLAGTDTFSQVKSVKYAEKNVGHANDATVYKKGAYKYLFVSVSGGVERSAKTSAGKTTKFAVIRLDDYNKGSNKVYGCTVKVKKGVKMVQTIKKSQFSGITFVGKRKAAGKKRPTVVFKDGRTFYAAYITISKKRAVTFTIFKSGRVNKPAMKYNGKSYSPATQGVTYHNNYLYLSYSGEGTGTTATLNNFLVTRITYKKLFKGGYDKIKNLQVASYRIAAVDGEALSKNIPEAVFFKTLNGKAQMYVNFNRAWSSGRDNDTILRSTQTY